MKRILAGPNAVIEALNGAPGRIGMVCAAEGMRSQTLHRIEKEAKRARVAYETLPRASVDALARGLNHQGVVAVADEYPYSNLDSIIDRAAQHPHPLLVVLDQVQDPHNLGAIARSAQAFGANGVIITKDRSAAITPAAVRASAGATELLPIARIVNLVRAIETLKQRGYRVYGTRMDQPTTLTEIDWTGSTALVLGNEGRGLRRLTVEHCDALFAISMPGRFDSLNVSSAAAVSLHEAARQRFGV
jgi:23S rRNA (guanosine2251-2'-O)-methyltransferase